MEITITDIAAQKIDEYINGKTGFLKLKYDTEDCGCVMNGVIALWFVNELGNDDREVKTNKGNIFVEKSKEVFYDEELIIDFLESASSFQLKNKSQYLNPRMNFFNKTKS